MEWDGINWVKTAGPVTPTGRQNHAMVFDSGLFRWKTIMFGGNLAGTPSVGNDTWEWDGYTWELKALARLSRLQHDTGIPWPMIQHEVKLSCLAEIPVVIKHGNGMVKTGFKKTQPLNHPL